MSSVKKLVRISMLLLSKSTSTFKITTLEDRSITAMHSKQGKVDNMSTDMCNLDRKQWEYLDNDIKESILRDTDNLLPPGKI